MNRRAFLARIGKGTAALAVLVHLPVEWVPSVGGARELSALEYLRRGYNQYRTTHELSPYFVYVGGALYRAVEAEMKPMERWMGRDERGGVYRLMFKDSRMVEMSHFTEWGYFFSDNRLQRPKDLP